MAYTNDQLEARRNRANRINEVMEALRTQLPKAGVSYADGAELDEYGLPRMTEATGKALAIGLKDLNPLEANPGGTIDVTLIPSGNAVFDQIYIQSVSDILSAMHGFGGHIQVDERNFRLLIEAEAMLLKPRPVEKATSAPSDEDDALQKMKRGRGHERRVTTREAAAPLVDICDITQRYGELQYHCITKAGRYDSIIDNYTLIDDAAREIAQQNLR